MSNSSQDDLTREVEDLEPAQAVIVPGAGVYADGSLGVPVRERVDAAVELYDAGLVEKILLSGDNGTDTYNEPAAMRRAERRRRAAHFLATMLDCHERDRSDGVRTDAYLLPTVLRLSRE